MRVPLALLAAVALLAACETPKPLVNVPLVWKPTVPFDVASESSTARIQFGTFKDVRDNPQLIAENREQKAPRSVTTRDDVGGFVASNMRTLFSKSGLTTVESGGDVILSGEVQQFFVAETDNYDGRVVLHLVLTDASGTRIWEGTMNGSASHFGRSYTAENYYETLSDSVSGATRSMLHDTGFRAAMARAALARR